VGWGVGGDISVGYFGRTELSGLKRKRETEGKERREKRDDMILFVAMTLIILALWGVT